MQMNDDITVTPEPPISTGNKKKLYNPPKLHDLNVVKDTNSKQSSISFENAFTGTNPS